MPVKEPAEDRLEGPILHLLEAPHLQTMTLALGLVHDVLIPEAIVLLYSRIEKTSYEEAMQSIQQDAFGGDAEAANPPTLLGQSNWVETLLARRNMFSLGKSIKSQKEERRAKSTTEVAF